ncbi:MAG: DegT/DnrJ/EryC1/StrS family aminotransferase [Pseudomonadota bacterium]
MKRFEKPFTQQEPIPETAINRAVDVMRSGRLHRYNIVQGEEPEVSALEREYAEWQGARFCLATTSGGTALQIAMRAAGVRQGDLVLANAWTLAPVPGAMHAVGAVPIFVEIGDDWLIDVSDLEQKAERSGARFLMLSHMRGHIGDMDAVGEICERHGITLIEDCAHTMGARWKGIRSGNFGRVSCFSTQTYKHINSGEGGFLTTDDEEIAARAIVGSGSYMLYRSHGARPDDAVFDRVRLDAPNTSSRMDNLRAAILRDQLRNIEESIHAWNLRYRVLEDGLRGRLGLRVIERPQHEAYVGSSFQFHAEIADGSIPEFLSGCAARGVEVKWFGAAEPTGFTSRFDSWRYLGEPQALPHTLAALSTTCDIRVPLTFTETDCRDVAEIIVEEAGRLAA